MLPGKHNEPQGWRNKLEGLTTLPGEAAWEKDLAWEKLQSRLQEKPPKKRKVWYWAAACFLAALMIPLLLTNKKENGLVMQEPLQKQESIISQPDPELPAVVSNQGQVEKKKPTNIIIKKSLATEIKNTVVQEEPVAVIAEPVVEKDPVIITDTATAVTALTPAKKKLAVVHINELETPSPQFYTQPNYEKKSLKITFRNGKTANQTIASQQQYEGGFKIKLSPKN